MGASGWIYFVPYQVDIDKALQELKQSVFQNGEYYTEAKFLNRINQSQGQPPPNTIQELLEMNGESGTHSIIDMHGISEIPEFGKVTPLSNQDLTHLFGTEKPTREMAENKSKEIEGLRKRWKGIYFTIFHDGLPNEILFTGISGD